MNAQISRFIHPIMQALCITLITAAASVMAQAQEAIRVETSINDVTDDGFPLILQHDYELGSETRTYNDNGEYVEDAAIGLGDFKSVTVGDITIPVGESTEVWLGRCPMRVGVHWIDGHLYINIKF
jgi:hypothetical protein